MRILILALMLLLVSPLNPLTAGTDEGQAPPGTPVAASGARSTLSDSDCGKCHRWQVWVLSTRGGKHQARLVCTDCHTHHPPSTWDVIPECGMCHIGEPHFAIQGCLTCHADPHAPMDLVLTRKMTEPCKSCHAAEGDQLRQYPSFHSNIHCTFCHTIHGFVPECVQCHKPHNQGDTSAPCNLCHHAHKPLVVQYGDEASLAAVCGGCHTEVAALLAQSQSKHAKLPCNTCHVQQHKMIPACGNCHGTPHPAAMMARFSACGVCHNTAHDLHK